MKRSMRLIIRIASIFSAAALLCFSARTVFAQEFNPNPPGEPVRLIFIHHSTGENWLMDDYGDLGRSLDANNYFVSDTNYGWGPDSIGDRTDIVNWPEWFGPERNEAALEALYNEDGQNSSYTRTLSDPGGQNEIIIFKSCFPNSNLEGSPDDPPIPGDYTYSVGSAKHIYNLLLDYFITQPEKMFVVVTAPPLIDSSLADNARAFNTWLVYEWLQDYSGNNVFVFDFYNVLTSPDSHHDYHDGQIRHVVQEGWNTSYYPSDGGDDHPNRDGSLKATEEFIPLLNIYYHRWQEGLGYPFPEGAATGGESEGEETESGTGSESLAPGEIFEDFENSPTPWSAYPDGQGSAIQCDFDSQNAYSGGASLRIAYTLVSGGWGDCMMSFDSPQDWSSASDISFYLRTSQPDTGVTLRFYVGDENEYAPFEAVVETSPESVDNWAQVHIPFSSFQRASWAEANSVNDFDPSRIMEINFNVWDGGAQGESSVWIDDMSLSNGGQSPIEQPEQASEEQQPAIQEEAEEGSQQEQEAEQESEGGFLRTVFQSACPLSTAGLPLAGAAIILLFRRYQR